MPDALNKQPKPGQSRNVSLAEMYPLIREVLDADGTFSLTITGTSMYP